MEDDPEYKTVLEKCGDFDYSGYIHVDAHLYALGSPQEDAIKSGCPFVVAYSKFDSDKIAHKFISIWNDHKEGEDMFEKDGSLYIGTFKLNKLAQAYQDTDPSVAGRYDVVSNSCADFVLGLGSNLGVKVDSRITSFVARRLVQVAGQELFDSIRQSLGFLSLFKQDRHLRASDTPLTNDQLIDLLVETHATRYIVGK